MGDDGNRLCELPRVRHRQVDLSGADALRSIRDAAREVAARLRTADDLDVLPGERARDAEAERLADGLLAGEPSGVALRRVGAGLAVRLLVRGEATVAEVRVALERTADARELDQIGADEDQRCSSIHSGRCPIAEKMPSGCSRHRQPWYG